MDTVTIHRIEDYWDTIARPVRAVHNLYRDFVDYEDLWSEATLWWYGPGEAHLDKYIDVEADHVLLRRSIYRYVVRYAEKEKAHKSGYEPIDQVRYTTREVLLLLPTALNPDGIPGGGGPQEGPSAKGNLAERGDQLASLIDVRRGIGRLPEEDVQFLHLAEDVRHDWEKVVEWLGSEVQADTARRRHARIVSRLTRLMNSYQKGRA